MSKAEARSARKGRVGASQAAVTQRDLCDSIQPDGMDTVKGLGQQLPPGGGG